MMQAGTDYGVEVIVAYENKRVGFVMHPPAMLRDRLVKLGYVKRLGPPKEEAVPKRQRTLGLTR